MIDVSTTFFYLNSLQLARCDLAWLLSFTDLPSYWSTYRLTGFQQPHSKPCFQTTIDFTSFNCWAFSFHRQRVYLHLHIVSGIVFTWQHLFGRLSSLYLTASVTSYVVRYWSTSQLLPTANTHHITSQHHLTRLITAPLHHHYSSAMNMCLQWQDWIDVRLPHLLPRYLNNVLPLHSHLSFSKLHRVNQENLVACVATLWWTVESSFYGTRGFLS
jgi:hypothetical protein